MNMARRMGAGLAAAALVTMAATPAMADPRRGHDRGGHGRQHDKDDDGDAVGGFVLGALLAGGLVAALSKKKEPKPLAADVAFVPVATVAGQPGVVPAQADPDAAIGACVVSAEEEARHHFAVAQVAGVTAVEPIGPGFAVKGDVLVRASYRETGERHGFRCLIDAERVSGVTIEGLPASAA